MGKVVQSGNLSRQTLIDSVLFRGRRGYHKKKTKKLKGRISMLNGIIIMGRLTRDPELRHTQAGTAVASFTLAVDRDFKDKSTGERSTDFIGVVAWRQTVEFVSRYFSKGRMAVVEGRLQIRDWTDKDGGKRRSAEVVADSAYFGDSKPGGESGPHPSPPAADTAYSPPSGGDGYAELSDDDGGLPF